MIHKQFETYLWIDKHILKDIKHGRPRGFFVYNQESEYIKQKQDSWQKVKAILIWEE